MTELPGFELRVGADHVMLVGAIGEWRGWTVTLESADWTLIEVSAPAGQRVTANRRRRVEAAAARFRGRMITADGALTGERRSDGHPHLAFGYISPWAALALFESSLAAGRRASAEVERPSGGHPLFDFAVREIERDAIGNGHSPVGRATDGSLARLRRGLADETSAIAAVLAVSRRSVIEYRKAGQRSEPKPK